MDKSKYLKDKQPPAVDDEGMVKVDVDVDITRILVIDEERNNFYFCFAINCFLCR